MPLAQHIEAQTGDRRDISLRVIDALARLVSEHGAPR